MIVNWVAAKAQQFLSVQDAVFDELNFDFALSAEIIDLLYAQNDDMDAVTKGAAVDADQQAEATSAAAVIRFALDEHELALA